MHPREARSPAHIPLPELKAGDHPVFNGLMKIAPTWDDIGQLAAIAAIRTFLNYFLERDLEAFMHERKPESGA